MKDQAIEKARILSQALPYIQKYNNKIVVIKYGGNAMTDEQLKKNVMEDVVLLSEIGVKIVLVHGGGPDINAMLKAVGKESKFIDGLRYTDEETMSYVQMVLAGKTNKNLVSMISDLKSKAVGICGMDGNIIEAKKHETPDLGYVGDIVEIHPQLIFKLLDDGYIPVVASIGTDDNHVYNINADMAASAIAGALNAENMVFVSNVPGVLKDAEDEGSLIPQIHVRDVQHLMEAGIISGGMIPKVQCCVDCVRQGVKKTVIIDGRIPHALLIEMLSDEGIGTMIVGDEYEEL
ncbi:acetylglutamate kinase [Catenisphaera adipataccumulans]|uniref:Acetylglutamate kinase n=1 Tax=Catenisphaera adipataccumulans TaxID=700500 RepID=A0A7W8CZ67_9FIRM|nr:acetylglutamate kinase [Catenisphaera adipataccumulans]MBB5183002.1 acetylglutamate kinase [Catenisphaera adipataccumulans]